MFNLCATTVRFYLSRYTTWLNLRMNLASLVSGGIIILRSGVQILPLGLGERKMNSVWLVSSGSTVLEDLTYYLKIEGLNPVAGTQGKKLAK